MAAAHLQEALNATERHPAVDELHEVPGQHGDWEPEQVEEGQGREGHCRSEGKALGRVHSKGREGDQDWRGAKDQGLDDFKVGHLPDLGELQVA